MSPLYATVLAERFPPVAEVEREAKRKPMPREIARRRRVLCRALDGIPQDYRRGSR